MSSITSAIERIDSGVTSLTNLCLRQRALFGNDPIAREAFFD